MALPTAPFVLPGATRGKYQMGKVWKWGYHNLQSLCFQKDSKRHFQKKSGTYIIFWWWFYYMFPTTKFIHSVILYVIKYHWLPGHKNLKINRWHLLPFNFYCLALMIHCLVLAFLWLCWLKTAVRLLMHFLNGCSQGPKMPN